jgi:hypothetical protein
MLPAPRAKSIETHRIPQLLATASATFLWLRCAFHRLLASRRQKTDLRVNPLDISGLHTSGQKEPIHFCDFGNDAPRRGPRLPPICARLVLRAESSPSAASAWRHGTGKTLDLRGTPRVPRAARIAGRIGAAGRGNPIGTSETIRSAVEKADCQFVNLRKNTILKTRLAARNGHRLAVRFHGVSGNRESDRRDHQPRNRALRFHRRNA